MISKLIICPSCEALTTEFIADDEGRCFECQQAKQQGENNDE